MWVFEEKVADLRKEYEIVVKIEEHVEATMVGRNAWIMKTEDAKRKPLEDDDRGMVMVRSSNNKGELWTDEIEVQKLSKGKAKKGGKHVMTTGEHLGKIVIHKRTDKGKCRVEIETEEGKRHIKVELTEMCPVE